MGRARAILAATLAAAFAWAAVPAHARTVTVVEEWIEVEDVAPAPAEGGTAERFVSGVPLEDVGGIATYGPFRVIDGSHAALVGITDERSPRQFAAMLRDFPALATLEMIECPGTFDDIANLELGRMIRHAGLATHVPRDGSVRSGAVELFLAGRERAIEDGARFAVHAWEDDSGLQAGDYSLAAPENRKYLAYYREMGMSPETAEAFYAMTNSVRFEDARWLSAEEMRGWSGAETAGAGTAAAVATPRLSYLELDLSAGLN